jgi:hypothetical protein
MKLNQNYIILNVIYFRCRYRLDGLCGLVVTGPGFDSWRYQIFCVAVGLEWGPLSIVRINEELLERKSSGSGQENRD